MCHLSARRRPARSVPIRISGASPDAPSLTLVFSDDFSINPNTNGQWTIHRYYGDTDNEASWDSKRHAWDLASAIQGRAAAVFANYELAATTWRAEFRYRAGNFQGMPGGDGFVFMFYKDKDAYGAPDIGNAKAFELFHGTPVKGYGLEFDDNNRNECEPSPTDFIALIKNDVCSFLGGPRVRLGRR